MRLEGVKTFDAPRDIVWRVLNSPEAMAKTMPGVESFDVHDARRWTANVKIPLGLGGLKMKIDLDKTDERDLEFAELHIKGQGVGAMLNMQTSFELSDDGGGGTKMKWTADVKLAGPVGSMGQRVLQPIVNQQVQHVLKALDMQVQNAISTPAEADRGPGPGSGTSGADAGISPLSPAPYEPDPQGPTTSTEDKG